jgi:hypothetical protein
VEKKENRRKRDDDDMLAKMIRYYKINDSNPLWQYIKTYELKTEDE